jgi:mono/diheme cytochrome c family protein
VGWVLADRGDVTAPFLGEPPSLAGFGAFHQAEGSTVGESHNRKRRESACRDEDLQECAGCHGDADGPSQWGTTSFYPSVPQFAQQPPRLTAPQMFWIVKHGVRYTGMGAWNGLLSDDEIWKVVTFLNHVEHLPPRVAEEFQRKR